MVITVWNSFEITSRDAVHQLQSCLDQLSQLSPPPPPPPLHHDDVDDHHARTMMEKLELTVSQVHITTKVYELLIQVLNHSLPVQGGSNQEETTDSASSKWAQVELDQCSFANHDTCPNFLPHHDDGGICSPDERARLGATLARRTLSVAFIDSPDILQCLSTTPILEIERLQFWQASLSTVECQGVSAILRHGCGRPLKHLSLVTLDLEQPQILVESIRNAIHLQELRIRPWHRARWWQTLQPNLYEAAHEMVLQLLQNSQNQLQNLWLQDMRLQDQHFMAMVETLPTSCLQLLNVQGNDIRAPGILALAAQLPRIKSLTEVVLESNAFDSSYAPKELYDECIAALIQGVARNPSIEWVCTSRLDKELIYCTHPNRVRRHISTIPDSIPIGLWPLILERVATRTRHSMWDDDDDRFQKYRATALYFVLQTCPILSSIGSVSLLTRNQRKRAREDQL